MSRAPGALLALCAGLLPLAGCAAPDPPPPPLRLSYQVEYRLVEGRAELEVALELPARAPARWLLAEGPGDGSPGELLAWEGPGPPRALRADAGGVVLLPPGTRRLRWVYPLDAVRERHGEDMIHGLGSPGAHLVAGSAYLLRPELVPETTEATLEFLGPRPQVPWRLDEQARCRLGWRDLIHPGFHTFGGRRGRVEVAGSEVEVALLPGPMRADLDALQEWVRAAAGEVAALSGDGRLPAERAVVTLIPTPGAEASPFGQFLSSSPASVAVYVGQAADADALRADWVLVHELCHALHPIVRPAQTWLSEGITTWLQQLARMRSGRLSEAQGWAGLVRGARAGQGEARGTPLGELSATLGRRHHAYRAVYWGGALFAVELDLELRRATGGRAGLLTLLARLRAAGPVCDQAAVAAEADRLAGAPLFSRLLAAHLDDPAFARLAPLLEALGVRPRNDGRVGLDEQAPRAAERRALLVGG